MQIHNPSIRRRQVLKILIANDDGIFAPGIRALAKRLSEEKKYEVYVVAPDRERSATGHSLTLHKPLRVQEVDIEADVVKAWCTTGTPSDSVKLAISVLLKTEPDLVIAGINNGSNMGSEILYSGTVAAAMEGTFSGIRSMAVSMVREGQPPKFAAAAEFIARFLNCYDPMSLSPKILVNINIPSIDFEELEGVSITELGIRQYNDWFEHRHDPRGNDYYWLAGHAIKEGERETSDAWAVHHNRVSITPVSFQMTDREAMETLKGFEKLGQIVNGEDKARTK
ncbi:5'/3'-nucleotidase SurE [bacterium]|nr:5'/3'-nucleotidase SurE [bacterium]